MGSPFDDLATSDAFEEFCFDLLAAEGFVDLLWRGPAADGGRDIEANWIIRDPTGGLFRSKWYVECKWYKDSVPFGEIEPKLLAASVARANYLLLMTSSRIRNSALDDVSQWLATRGKPFEVRYWTATDLLRLAVKHSAVFRKHFPKLSPPGWGHADALLRQISSLALASQQLAATRVVQSLQWMLNSLSSSAGSAFPLQGAFIEEIDIAAAILRAQDLLSPLPLEKPSLRPVDLASSVRRAVSLVNRRGLAIAIGEVQDCKARTSKALTDAALFELIFNAAIHSEPADAAVKLTVADAHWTLEIENSSPEAMPATWPVLGYRGLATRSRHSSGLGLGCWLASEIAKACDLNLSWIGYGGRWTTRMEGAIG